MKLTDAKSMADADARAIHVAGIPSTLLMTNAAAHVAKAAYELLPPDKRSAALFCGSGNNGGDGVAAALWLLRRGVCVRVFLVGERQKMTEDTMEMARRLMELGGCLEEFNPDSPEFHAGLKGFGVLVDAMFGVGLRAPLKGKAARAAALMNASGIPVVAADISSGVFADSGAVRGEAVRATKTVTFSLAKPGHFSQPGCLYTGELEIADIGIPREYLEDFDCGVYAVTEADVCLPPRDRLGHKGDFGRVLIVGGSVGYTGAPVLSARAAQRLGAGLVSLGVPREIYPIAAVKLDEAMPFPLACDESGLLTEEALPEILRRLETCDVCVLGPGLGRSEAVAGLVREIVSRCEKPMVADADALFALSQSPEVLQSCGHRLVLTPHEGEFLRLGGGLTGDRISDARDFVRKTGCALVLKGHRTLSAFPDGEVHISTTGNPGMAKGGSGDVLAGAIGALLCRMPVKDAVTAAVWICGRAGDLCAEKLGETGLLPSDVIETLPYVTKNMEK